MKPSPSLLPVFQCLCSIFRVEPDPWRALRLSASFGPSRLFYLSDAVPHSALLLSRFTRVRLCAALWTAAQQAPRSWDSPGKTPGVGCHCLLSLLITLQQKAFQFLAAHKFFFGAFGPFYKKTFFKELSHTHSFLLIVTQSPLLSFNDTLSKTSFQTFNLNSVFQIYYFTASSSYFS